MIASTMLVSSVSRPSPLMNVRSIFSDSTGKRLRYESDE